MSKELIQTQMNVNNRQVRVMRVDNVDYISLTDLCRLYFFNRFSKISK